MANVAAPSADEPSPGPLPKRESKPAVPFVPNETLRDQRQPDGKRRPDAQPSPSPSPQQPRPMTSLTSLQLWLNKPKIDQRVQELERQIGQIAHGEAGQGNPELHEFLVTLVTQLFEAEAQAKKADKKEAQATAALLATVAYVAYLGQEGLAWRYAALCVLRAEPRAGRCATASARLPHAGRVQAVAAVCRLQIGLRADSHTAALVPRV
jgi:hypothetical protein